MFEPLGSRWQQRVTTTNCENSLKHWIQVHSLQHGNKHLTYVLSPLILCAFCKVTAINQNMYVPKFQSKQNKIKYYYIFLEWLSSFHNEKEKMMSSYIVIVHTVHYLNSWNCTQDKIKNIKKPRFLNLNSLHTLNWKEDLHNSANFEPDGRDRRKQKGFYDLGFCEREAICNLGFC